MGKEKEVRLRISQDAYERFLAVSKNLDFPPTTLAAIWVMEKLVAVESATANAQVSKNFIDMMKALQVEIPKPTQTEE